MANSVYPTQTGASSTTNLANFIPEIWSSETVAAFKAQLALQPLIKSMSMVGKRGDTIHVPKPSRHSATAVAQGTAVTIRQDTVSEVQININKHFEFSRLVYDIAAMQALPSQRSFYIDDAAFALSKQVDSDLHNLGKHSGDGDGSSWVNSGSWYCDAGTSTLTAFAEDTVSAADVFRDDCFRTLIQKQDDANTPFDNRSFVIPPSLRNAIMGIDRYVSSDFVEPRGAVTKGKIGEIYGIPIYVSTNCPVVEAASDNTANTNDLKQAFLLHRDSLVIAMQQNIRTQTQYKAEWLGDLIVSDTVYGCVNYRDDTNFNMVVNA